MNFEELKEAAQRLLLLLEDPQPGTSSWWRFLHEDLERIRNWKPDTKDLP